MIDTGHASAAPDDTEKDFDVGLIRTHALTVASEALAQVDLAHVRTHRKDTTARGQGSYLVELFFSICLRRE